MLFGFHSKDMVSSILVILVLVLVVPVFFVSAYHCYKRVLNAPAYVPFGSRQPSQLPARGEAPRLWEVWTARRGDYDALMDLLVRDIVVN